MTTTQTMAMIRMRSARRRRRRSTRNTVAVTTTRTMLTGVVQVLVVNTKGANLAPVPGPASSSSVGRRARAVAPSETLVAMAENASTSSSPHMEVKNHRAMDLASKSPMAENLALRVVDTGVLLRHPSTALVICLVVLKKSPRRRITDAAVTTKMSTAQGGRSMAREDTAAALVADTERRDMEADIR
jgi:hypothetical protein